MTPAATAVVEELARAARELPANSLARLAAILEGASALTEAVEAAMLAVLVQPASRERVREIVGRLRKVEPPVPPVAVAWALSGASACDAWHREHGRIDLVWTGPTTLSLGIYRTQQTLLEVIDGAVRSLLIVAFAAYRVEGVRRALAATEARGVDVILVVETDEGPGGKVDYGPLRALVEGTGGFRVFEWPAESRPRDGDRYGALHAKCALADDEVLFVSSANMTGHALELNMELGVVIRGGAVPAQAGRHFDELMRTGILRQMV
jgi:cardiolipin synthase A/B